MAATLAACGRDVGPTAWISERSAVVRCVSAGPRPPAPILGGLPVPPVPTGLLARQLDPLALDELGYTRDAMVCATLEVPLRSSLDLGAGLDEVVSLHARVGSAAERIAGRCACEAARRQGLRELVGDCPRTAARTGCTDESRDAAVAAEVAPLVEALDDVTLPWVHWRLVGPTDRPGWFAEHLTSLVANHEGGAVVMIRDQPAPPRQDEVARALLAHEDVVAVVRQDGGQALLVAREKGGLLVLDHFARPRTSAALVPLVGAMEEAQISAMTELLVPAPPRAGVAEIGSGTTIELDRPLLEELDRQIAATHALVELPMSSGEVLGGPPALFDRVVFTAPHGSSGEVLQIDQVLSLEGLAWAQTLGDDALVSSLDALGLRPDIPPPALDPDEPRRFVLRGRDTASWAFHGVHRFGELATALDLAVPGATSGTASKWHLEWPGTPLPGNLAPPRDANAPYAALRRMVSGKPYALDASFDPARTKLTIELRPK